MNNIVIKPHKTKSKSEYSWGKIFKMFVSQQWYKGFVVCLQEDMIAYYVATELLTAHVMASASFSICAYLRSVFVMDREAYATGRQDVPFAWSSTAPSPNDEASADILVCAWGSYTVKMWGVVSSVFN